MEMLVLVLNQPEYLEDILQGFLSCGIRGATVIDSTGMGRTLCDKVPIFGGIRSMLQGCRPNNLTIFTVLKDSEMRQKAVDVIHRVLGDLQKPNTGFLFSVPVITAEGFAGPLDE